MTRRIIQRRLTRLHKQANPAIPPQFIRFARAVIAFGGAEPTTDAVEQLARWYAGGYRSEPFGM